MNYLLHVILACLPILGGYTTGSKELIDLLRNRARPYLFSNTLAPAVVGVANKVKQATYSRQKPILGLQVLLYYCMGLVATRVASA